MGAFQVIAAIALPRELDAIGAALDKAAGHAAAS
jgi:hypothetical protein